jgi:hypothetical protein
MDLIGGPHGGLVRGGDTEPGRVTLVHVARRIVDTAAFELQSGNVRIQYRALLRIQAAHGTDDIHALRHHYLLSAVTMPESKRLIK